ncbi:MAG: folate family ECF transporter S component [Lachnospiraceae bacterium]|nr:folate family ECF transporter S component [Lachnospiraceae bacterium]
MKKIRPKHITYIAVFTAMEVVLSRFLSFNAWNLKIGFNFVPIVLVAMLMGPIPAGLVAALGDFIGAILFPIGAYFPGFTFTAFLTGIIFGVFLFERQSYIRTLSAVLINQLILSLLLNSLWISILYGSPYIPLLSTRIVQCGILIPVQFIVITVIQQAVLLQIKKVIE